MIHDVAGDCFGVDDMGGRRGHRRKGIRVVGTGMKCDGGTHDIRI